MSSEIIVALFSLVGTMMGTFSGVQLTNYRLKQLEEKVNRHNGIIERLAVICDLSESALRRSVQKSVRIHTDEDSE